MITMTTVTRTDIIVVGAIGIATFVAATVIFMIVVDIIHMIIIGFKTKYT